MKEHTANRQANWKQVWVTSTRNARWIGGRGRFFEESKTESLDHSKTVPILPIETSPRLHQQRNVLSQQRGESQPPLPAVPDTTENMTDATFDEKNQATLYKPKEKKKEDEEKGEFCQAEGRPKRESRINLF